MSSTVDMLLHQPQSGVAMTVAGDFPLDENVVSQLPKGTKVLSANQHGHSDWTVTACIVTQLPDGTLKKYFLKCVTGDAGQAMMEGEYWAMTELFKTIPHATAMPIARGRFQRQHPPTYFLLCDFLDMINQMPDPDRLCALIIDLHRNSISPTGKFGFHVRTYQGKTPQAVEWEDSWTQCFTNLMQHILSEDLRINGLWPELEQVGAITIWRVIPRLIGALEREGRSVKPCLIHADLWEGNTGTLLETSDVVLFDASSYYAHNEMEIGDWRCPYNKIHSEVYTETYLRHYGMSEPIEEWDDRNRMYSVYYNIMYSVNHGLEGRSVPVSDMLEGRTVRKMAYDDMCFLANKYTDLIAKESASLEREEKIQRLDAIRAEAAREEEMVWARTETEIAEKIAEIKRRGQAKVEEIKRRETASIEELL